MEYTLLEAALDGTLDDTSYRALQADFDARLPRRAMTRLSKSAVFALHHVTLKEAARQLGVGTTTLKLWHKPYGKWPHRQLKSLRMVATYLRAHPEDKTPLLQLAEDLLQRNEQVTLPYELVRERQNRSREAKARTASKR